MLKINQRRRNLKKKLRNREKVFGAWTSLYHPSIAEIFCRSGVDFVGIDIEHGTVSLEQSQNIIAACQSYSALCLPRIASHNMEMIKRLLDSGADGIIAPMVSLPEEASKIVSWCKYPPQGQRSFGISRAHGYGFDFMKYAEEWNKALSIIVQIESIQGLNNIEKILSNDDIDGIMVGPYDISGSLGIPGQLEHRRVIEASKQVIAACDKYGKACGTQLIEPDERRIKDALSLGYTFVVLASDIFILWKWSQRMNNVISKFRKIKK